MLITATADTYIRFRFNSATNQQFISRRRELVGGADVSRRGAEKVTASVDHSDSSHPHQPSSTDETLRLPQHRLLFGISVSATILHEILQ